MLFLQIKSLKCRHPLGVVVALAGNHRPPGERPVSLLGFRLAARASTLFCLIRPGRANRQNSPARASDEAGQPPSWHCATLRCGPSSLPQLLHAAWRLVRFHRTPAPLSLADAAHPVSALNGLHQGRPEKFGLGAIFPHPPRGLGGRLSFSLYYASFIASLFVMLDAPYRSLRSKAASSCSLLAPPFGSAEASIG